ncbi:MAG TPA: hypothetical protein VGC07_01470 [Granulicella sp.]
MLNLSEPNDSVAVSLLHELAGVIGALAWPAIALFVLIRYRGWIERFLPVLIEKFRSAESFEAWGVKLTAAKDLVEAAVNEPANRLEASRAVPEQQVKNAATLNAQLQSSGADQKIILVSVEEPVRRLAAEYESIRATMPHGPQRTVEMNRIMGSLRTLGIAAKPMLPKLTISSNPGERLAAIAVLQTEPDASYLRWLSERFQTERPFIFFHAALALRQFALTRTYPDPQAMQTILEDALARIEGYTGGDPDSNTLEVLHDALRIMQQNASQTGNYPTG